MRLLISCVVFGATASFAAWRTVRISITSGAWSSTATNLASSTCASAGHLSAHGLSLWSLSQRTTLRFICSTLTHDHHPLALASLHQSRHSHPMAQALSKMGQPLL